MSIQYIAYHCDLQVIFSLTIVVQDLKLALAVRHQLILGGTLFAKDLALGLLETFRLINVIDNLRVCANQPSDLVWTLSCVLGSRLHGV
jgi:hypothetical protein